MTPAHYRLIRDQMKLDLFGKDAFRGVTLSYTWLANQFGHFALGLIPTAIGYSILGGPNKGNETNLLAYSPTIGVWLLWFVFEFLNFTRTISVRRKDPIGVKNAKKTFYDPRKWHFRADWFTDLCFFALGGVAAIFLFTQHLYVVFICIMFLIVLFYQFKYWYPAKIYLQRALYPFQYRLSQWTSYMSDENKNRINEFMESDAPKHLMVFGENDDEKIRMCVGIGSETSYQLKKCRYITAMKLFECFYRETSEENGLSDAHSWNWLAAQLLIIDDINPSACNIPNIISTQEFYSNLVAKNAERNKTTLINKKVIWVLGDEDRGKEEKEWKALLKEIGVHESNIITINLSDNNAAPYKPAKTLREEYGYRTQS